MYHCPQCLTEYRDGFFQCADCRVPLAPGPPPSPSEMAEVELVTVFETTDSFALALAKGSLEEAGIQYGIIGDDPRWAVDVGMSRPCQCQIQVAREDEREARELLEPLVHPDPDSLPEGGEI